MYVVHILYHLPHENMGSVSHKALFVGRLQTTYV